MPRCEKYNSLMQTTFPIHFLRGKKLNCYPRAFLFGTIQALICNV